MKAYHGPLGAAGVAAAISALCFFWSGNDDDAARTRPVAPKKPAQGEPAAHAVAERTNGSWILFLSHRSGRNVLSSKRFSLLVWAEFLLVLIVTCVESGASIAEERRNGTWDAICQTDLRNRSAKAPPHWPTARCSQDRT